MQKYPSDLTDRQWQVMEKTLCNKRKRRNPLRTVINALLYITKSGCQWRMLPKEYPLWQSVYYYFRKWKRACTLEEVHDALASDKFKVLPKRWIVEHTFAWISFQRRTSKDYERLTDSSIAFIQLLRGMPLRVGNARAREKANAPAFPHSSQRSMNTRIRFNLSLPRMGIASTTGALHATQVKANAIKPACRTGRAGVPSPREPKRPSCERHSP